MLQYRRYLVLLVAGLVASLMVSGCSGTSDSNSASNSQESPDGGDASTNTSDGSLGYANLTPEQQAALDACEQATGERTFENCPPQILCSSLDPTATVPVQLTFDPLQDECPWSTTGGQAADGNGPKLNEFIRARVEQVQDISQHLEVPEGEIAVFCRINISIVKLNDQFKYDDDLILVFGGSSADSGADGGVMLMTKNKMISEITPTAVAEFESTSWPLYSWDDVYDLNLANGAPNNELASPMCFGHGDTTPLDDQGNPLACQLPDTDVNGENAIDLTNATAEAIGIRAALNGNYNLSVVITGDNDSSSDCKHQGFIANLDVGYISLPQAEVEKIKPDDVF
ncbi:MAG: hypothetical protein IPJ88_15430 [Myxococcales bacterium]|nr:MAG: hypothetical protein IPJ88_15430 [Myxococcales bacterium]